MVNNTTTWVIDFFVFIDVLQKGRLEDKGMFACTLVFFIFS